jgi:hypothetical protein
LKGLGIGAGVLGGAIAAGGIYQYRKSQTVKDQEPELKKMSARTRLIMFARKFPKRIGQGKIPTGHGKPLTPKQIEESVADLKKVWQGGGITSPEIRLPPKKDVLGISQPSSRQVYTGDTLAEVQQRERNAGLRKDAGKLFASRLRSWSQRRKTPVVPVWNRKRRTSLLVL